MKNIFLKFMFNILKNYMKFTMIYNFYLKQWKLKKIERLFGNLHDETEYAIHIRKLKQALDQGLALE